MSDPNPSELELARLEAEALRLEVTVLRAKLAELEFEHGQTQKRKQRRIDALTEALRLAESALS